MAKATGQTRYVGDMSLPGMLHAAIAVSDRASARILSLDVAPLREMPGVEAVVTGDDIPGDNQIGVIFPDQPLVVTDRIRMVGDRLALVAARSAEEAWAAARAIAPKLEDLPGVFDPEEALTDDAPVLHGNNNLLHTFQVLRDSDTSKNREAEVVVEARYEIGGQDHAYLEPQACLAVPEGDRITIFASCQCPFYIQQAVARVLAIPLASVRVEQAPTGGAFGGKEDYPSEPAACAALLAWKTRRPVRLLFGREFDLQVTTKRHAMVVKHRWGADRNGQLVFAEVEAILDGGAYAGLSTVVAERANVSAIGPYSVPRVAVRTRIAYTNNLFGGAYRGFGAPQVSFAAEATMDDLARRLGMDPVKFRRHNLVTTEDPLTCTNQPLAAPEMARACLDRAVMDASRFDGPQRAPASWQRGRGVSLVLYGINLHRGGQFLDRSSAVVILQPDASVIVRVGLTEMGQGNLTAVQTVTAAALGIDPAMVQVWQPDTTTVADSGPTVASRGSHSAGRAVLDAIERLRHRLDPIAADLLGCRPEDVRLEDNCALADGEHHSIPLTDVTREMAARRIETIATGWFRSEPREFDEATGIGAPYASYAMACHVADVAVDPDLGLVTVEHVAAAHDVGRVLHQTAAQGQIEGGVVQAMGWALTEELKLDRGRLLNPGFSDYLIPTADDAPKVTVAFLEDAPGRGPFGAKGIGEPAFIPTAAAIRNAVSRAIEVEINHLPITPPIIVRALGNRHRFSHLVDS
jgi:CO/xanthine dehydrogenase Mo-binding subunit